MQHLRQLSRHLAWADTRTLDSLRSMSEAPQQAVDLYAHILAAEHVWLRRVTGVEPTYEVWPTLGLDECERLARNNHAEFEAVVRTADASRLAEPVSYTNTRGQSFETPLEDILLHVTHHGMYHRGQVALLVRAAGGAPLATDYIAWRREHAEGHGR